MILRQWAFITFAACLVCGCDSSVPLSYATRGEAEAERLFARGWLPEVIPPSSRNISMRNDLDLNISNGEFSFDPLDHEPFVRRLERVPSRDEDGCPAYALGDWIFWIPAGKNHCRFHMRLNRNKKPSEQGGAEQPAGRTAADAEERSQ